MGDARQLAGIATGHVLELAAMIDGERHQAGNGTAAIGRPVQVVEGRVLAQGALGAALG